VVPIGSSFLFLPVSCCTAWRACFWKGYGLRGCFRYLLPYYHSGGSFREHLSGRLKYVFPYPEEMLGSPCFVCGFSELKRAWAKFVFSAVLTRIPQALSV